MNPSPPGTYTLPAGVAIHIVRVLNARKYGNCFSSVGIEIGQARRFMRGDKEPVIRFIQSHREIVLECHGPANDRVSLPVDHGNLFQVWQIHVDVGASGFQSKGLRMRSQFVFFRQPFVGSGIDGAESTPFPRPRSRRTRGDWPRRTADCQRLHENQWS